MKVLMNLLAGFLFVFLGIVLIFYILGNLGLMGIANQTNTKDGWHGYQSLMFISQVNWHSTR